MKVLYIDYEDAGNFKVLANEQEITSDQMQAVSDESAELIRFSERAGGLFERAEIEETTENDAGDELEEYEYSISKWAPIA